MPPAQAAPPAQDAAVPAAVRVVGIGASAGGLQALEQFLAQVPPSSGLAYLVVQHLDPTQKAMLAQLLQRTTRMPVREATERLRIEADAVYVIPPNKALTLASGTLHLATPEQPRGLRRPIDELFESIASEQRGQAVGVVLSGMGSDGTAGLKAIRAAGGLTLAQAPETAQFDSMPRSALAAGCVDIVCAPGEMPRRMLAALARDATVPAPGAEADAALDAAAGAVPPAATATLDSTDGLIEIVQLLRAGGKHDFLLYKHSTLLRRIERRMGVHRLPSLQAYAQMLRANPQEVDLLCKELLIGVTGFFRDRAVWQCVKDEVLPQLLAAQADGWRMRAWVAGCSTGEEAYTLAMLFREVVAALPGHAHSTLQIFATDLSRDAIEVARRGVYPPSIAGEVSAERLARFFVAQDGGWRIAKSIRETIVFAQHDVIVDPPFTKLDLLSCRNLLIYLAAPLQRRLLPLFHYSLRPGGVLLLGSSETVGRHDELFEPLEPRQRLYRRRENTRPGAAPDFPPRAAWLAAPAPKEPPVPEDPTPQPTGLQALADRLLLQELAPPAVLVNDRGDIVYISGHTGRYLEPAAGKANWNIHVMAREGLRGPLDGALRQAVSRKDAVELHALPVDGDGPPRAVDISVRALDEPAALQGLLLIVFREVAAVPPRSRRRRSSVVHGELEAELERAREEAQALREEMRASQEELQAANEELQSSNEELQSTNEELTSSKEEMQSMNEELHAVNAELQSKLDDLALAQSDMHNLLNSTDIATLFLDKELKLRRYTEKARRIIALRDSDVGRPLSDLTSQLEYPGLQDDVQEMLRTLVIAERQIHSRDGHWYAVRIMPYRTPENVIQGAVITFVDITAAKELEARLRGG
ncbi:MAG: chemotaxis protein CheB [Rubrivivax sp.]|nr:chemotaxis protein CheB [Rubrivivax sp.]